MSIRKAVVGKGHIGFGEIDANGADGTTAAGQEACALAIRILSEAAWRHKLSPFSANTLILSHL